MRDFPHWPMPRDLHDLRSICVWARIPRVANKLLHGNGDFARRHGEGPARRRDGEGTRQTPQILFPNSTFWAKAIHCQVTGQRYRSAGRNVYNVLLRLSSTRNHPRWRGSSKARAQTETCSLSEWKPPSDLHPGLGQKPCFPNRS